MQTLQTSQQLRNYYLTHKDNSHEEKGGKDHDIEKLKFIN